MNYFLINLHFVEVENFPCWNVKEQIGRDYHHKIGRLVISKFSVCVATVWRSPESKVLSNSVFFVANWPIGSQSRSHVIRLTNHWPRLRAKVRFKLVIYSLSHWFHHNHFFIRNLTCLKLSIFFFWSVSGLFLSQFCRLVGA